MSSIVEGLAFDSVSFCFSGVGSASSGFGRNVGLLVFSGGLLVLRFFKRAQVVGNDFSLIGTPFFFSVSMISFWGTPKLIALSIAS